ncbi:MAG: hypothetical protein MMC23_004597 [Stictis urceolatum]|nr:hypothetical protein [Stictis urceolata]
MNSAEFKSYFMAHDLVIGFVLSSDQLSTLHPSPARAGGSSIPNQGVALTQDQMSSINLGTSKHSALPTPSTSASSVDLTNWKSTYAFSYYIKPNYPGRSSHLCNAGFIVPVSSRGLGLGGIAGRSFLYYGPKCGYRGSVFNLVYASNEASVRIWERLGFQNVGRIPEAGRLKTADGEGEEYVDAWVVYGDFAKIGQNDE